MKGPSVRLHWVGLWNRREHKVYQTDPEITRGKNEPCIDSVRRCSLAVDFVRCLVQICG